MGFYWVLKFFSGFCWILLGFTGLQWIFLDFIVCHMVLLGFTGFYWALLGFTGLYWVKSRLIGSTLFFSWTFFPFFLTGRRGGGAYGAPSFQLGKYYEKWKVFIDRCSFVRFFKLESIRLSTCVPALLLALKRKWAEFHIQDWRKEMDFFPETPIGFIHKAKWRKNHTCCSSLIDQDEISRLNQLFTKFHTM